MIPKLHAVSDLVFAVNFVLPLEAGMMMTKSMMIVLMVKSD